MQLTGAQALIKSLEMQGVDVMFGLPGGAILPVYDPIIDSSIRHILVRHEQGAGHMAEGYAMVTGKPGVAMVTSGPGATNIVTPLANAYMDSTPLVVVSGQVATASIGTDAFQECDITGVTMGITKHNWLIKNVNDIPRVVAAAFHVATTGPSGPGPHRLSQGHRERDHGVVLALLGRRARSPGLPPGHLRRPRPGPPSGGADRLGPPPGLLRRRRRPQGTRRRTAAHPGRAHGHPGRDDAHGARRLPRLASAGAGHARDARALHGGDRHAEQRPADQPGGAFRRPGHRQDQRLRPRGQDHPRRHRPGRAGQGAHARRGHRR